MGEPAANDFWQGLREQTAAFFAGDAPLWRLSLPSVAPPLDLPGDSDRVGRRAALAARRRRCECRMRETRRPAGGHATLFRGGHGEQRAGGVFTPLAPALMEVHRRLKQRFDPYGVFNPGRLYPESEHGNPSRRFHP
jgi:glycolate oxidase FAD binding subunit